MNIQSNVIGVVSIDYRQTDVIVSKRNAGYFVAKRDAPGSMPVADRIGHLIGKRIVQAPKKDSQITEAHLFAEIERALG